MLNIPRHLGVIVDGNRRWAQERKLPTLIGHRKGLDNVKKLMDWSREKGIKTLTVFVFSTENWQRSKSEVSYLMNLLGRGLDDFKRDIKNINKKGIRMRVIGQKDRLSASLKKKIETIESLTKDNKEFTVNLALSYGGRAEITQVIKNIIEKKIAPEDITEEVVSKNLWTSELDLLIRTGKEQRISNFLIWQAAYAELYFLPKYWPDFAEKDLDEALRDYVSRKIRRGK